MTGINVFNAEVASKRLELLRDLVPDVAHIAVLVNPADAMMMETQLGDMDRAARAMGLHIQTLDTNTSAEIDAASLSGGSQGVEFTSAFGRATEVHGRTASAAFEAYDSQQKSMLHRTSNGPSH